MKLTKPLDTILTLLLGLSSAALAQPAPRPPGGDMYLVSYLTGNGLLGRLPTVLYKLDLQTGQILPLRELIPGGDEAGLDFILPDYERRIVVLARPPYKPTEILTVPMDDPTVVAGFPVSLESAPTASRFLVDHPPEGLQLAIGVWKTGDAAPLKYLGVPLSKGSPDWLPPSAVAYQRRYGYFGTVADNPGTPEYVRSVHGGKLGTTVNGEAVEFGLDTPAFLSEFVDHTTGMTVKNDVAMVLEGPVTNSPDGLGSSVTYVYCYATRTWAPVRLPGSSTRVRSFGPWLAFVVSEPQPWMMANGTNTRTYHPALQRVSPGQTGRLGNKPWGERGQSSMEGVFFEARDWFPGVLYLYHVNTGRTYRLETGEGDSEIILVDGLDVYYRVNTSLYRATIGERSLGNTTKLLTDAALGNVHFAFVSRSKPRE
jgi:hypothetical protein